VAKCLIKERTEPVTSQHRTQPLVIGAFAVGVIGLLTFFVHELSDKQLKFSGLWDGFAYHVPIAAGLVALVVAVRGTHGRLRVGWILLMVSYVIWSQGSLWWKLVQQRNGQVAAFNGIDGLRLLLYPLAAAGLWLIAGHSRLTSVDPRPTLRSAITERRIATETVAAGLTIASLCGAAAQKAVTDNPLNNWASLTNLAYPLGDALLLIVLVMIAAHRRWTMTSTWWVLMASVAIRFIANVRYVSISSTLGSTSSSARDAIWPATALGIAFAAHVRPNTQNPSKHMATRLAVLPILVGLAAVAVAVLDAHPITIALGLLALVLVLFGFVLSAHDDARTEAIGAASVNDLVTGLLNRNGFLLAVEGTSGPITVVVVDLTEFRDVNETLGRDVGDEVLAITGQRLIQVLPETSIVGRLSGDEFVVAVPIDLSRHDDSPEQLCQLIAATISAPLGFDVTPDLRVDAVCGAVRSDVRSLGSALELLRDADLALVTARLERRPFCVFNSNLASLIEHRRLFTFSLRGEALNDDLLVYLQPKVELATGKIVGAEALARWHHPELGVLAPSMFIPALNGRERQGLTRQMLRKVLNEIARTNTGRVHVPVAVNLTVSDLMNPRFASALLHDLQESGIDSSQLTVELTEEEIMRDWERCAGELTKLRNGGVRVAIDDFGTGYSSLAVLHRLPFDELKLDRSFLHDLTTSARARATLEAIFAVTKGLRVNVVAEGVERTDDRDLLVGLGCVYGQGFLFSGAVSTAAFSEMVAGSGLLAAVNV
jgi:diguanylate cyclase